MKYSAAFLEYFTNTQHAGSLEGDDVHFVQHQSVQPFSSVRFYIRVLNGLMVEVSFHASVTPVLIAASEYVCRWMEGKTLELSQELMAEQILKELSLAPIARHQVDLIMSAVKKIF